MKTEFMPLVIITAIIVSIPVALFIVNCTQYLLNDEMEQDNATKED